MAEKKSTPKNVFILGVASDIGRELAERYLDQGYNITGASRSSLKGFLPGQNARLLRCDIGRKAEVKKCVDKYRKLAKPWDIFISTVGTLEPIGKFFDCDFNRWEYSVAVNSISQLRFLHAIYPLRRKDGVCNVIFFAGGGTNKAFTNYSAYCSSKIMLIKMCELLDDENKDLNVFIVGPGWVRTKIHDQTLGSRFSAGESYKRTLEFLKSDNPGTDYQDIYDCINWCLSRGRAVSGGRNFSVVYDQWKAKGAMLARQLRADPDKFKLRRFKNK